MIALGECDNCGRLERDLQETKIRRNGVFEVRNWCPACLGKPGI